MLDVALVFGWFAIVAFTARTASERGRNALGWGALAVTASVVGGILGSWAFGWSFGHDDTASSLGRVMLGLFAAMVGPFAAMLAILVLVWRLPESVPTLSGTCWTLYRLSSKDEPAGECELAVEAGVLRIGERCLAAGALTELAADGECLRIGWAGGSTVLMPTGDERTSREKAKQSQTLEKRLRQLLG